LRPVRKVTVAEAAAPGRVEGGVVIEVAARPAQEQDTELGTAERMADLAGASASR